jgi:Leucine-rich repeat (LRR) protein
MFLNLEKRFRLQGAIECILLIFLVELCRCQQSSDICNLISSKNNASYGCTLQKEADAALIPKGSVSLHLSFSSDHQFVFTDGFVPSLPSLETLHLYVSQGSGKLPAGFFSKLGHLKKLMLYKDESAPESFELQLEDDTFIGLESLTDLHMPDLGISTLPVEVFNGLGKLKKLNLGKNRVSEVKYGTFRSNCCHEMRNLFLGMNNISDIGKISFNGLDSLLTIDLHGNKISTVRHLSFLNLILLTDVNLGANKIASIERFAFNGLDNLRKLYLDLNELTRVESSMFDGLPSLTVLDLSNNRMDDLARGAFAKLQFLRDLSLRHNKISSIVADAFEGLRSLDKLELRGNQIHVLDETTFYGLRNLKVLELEHNKISVIQKNTFIPVLHLRELYLQHNRLTRLSPEDTKLSDLTSLTTFNVSHNSWHCTCVLKPLVDWMKDRKFETPHLQSLCASPGKERNTSISDFISKNCSNNEHFSTISPGQFMEQKSTASGKTTIYRQLLFLLVSLISKQSLKL